MRTADISEKMKERFCKDCKIPISIFQEPYFSKRLELLDPYYDTLQKYHLFCAELSKYRNEQEYLEAYNTVKDTAINFIKDTMGYKKFNNEDMNQYAIVNIGLPNKDIFKPTNDNRTFISIDMKKANFTSLHTYSPDIFNHAETWEDFIRKFTDNQHIINSKYIRQVILGNCNPKRHITYEKYLMDNLLIQLKRLPQIDIKNVVFFSNDEIILDLTYCSQEEQNQIIQSIHGVIDPAMFKVELFTLHKIQGANGYIKRIDNGTEPSTYDFKCVDSLMIPFIIRTMKDEPIQEEDKIFIHEGLLAQFVKTPDILIETIPFLKEEERDER